MPTFSYPVVFEYKESFPIAVFLLPVLLFLRASSPNKTSNANFLNKARKYLEKETNCECIGPLPDIISKVRGNFRHSLLLKAKTLPTLHKNTKNLVEGYIEKQKRLKVRWSVDFNPIDYQ